MNAIAEKPDLRAIFGAVQPAEKALTAREIVARQADAIARMESEMRRLYDKAPTFGLDLAMEQLSSNVERRRAARQRAGLPEIVWRELNQREVDQIAQATQPGLVQWYGQPVNSITVNSITIDEDQFIESKVAEQNEDVMAGALVKWTDGIGGQRLATVTMPSGMTVTVVVDSWLDAMATNDLLRRTVEARVRDDTARRSFFGGRDWWKQSRPRG